MYFLLSRIGRLFVGAIFVAAITSLIGFSTLTTVPVASRQSSASCAVSPDPAALDQLFTVSASGLPTGGTVNLIETFPNGTVATSPISVSSNGTYTLTESSADSLFPAEQTGLYTFHFVGKVKWPQGTYNQSYATCSENVT
jgi:hypothetical protein